MKKEKRKRNKEKYEILVTSNFAEAVNADSSFVHSFHQFVGEGRSISLSFWFACKLSSVQTTRNWAIFVTQ